MSVYSTEKPPEDVMRAKRRRDALTWVAMLGAPVIWLTHLQFIYSLVWWSFMTGRTWPMHVAAAISAVLCVVCFVVAWRIYRRLPRETDDESNEVEDERVRLFAHLGLWGALLFVLGIAGQWTAVLMVNPRID